MQNKFTKKNLWEMFQMNTTNNYLKKLNKDSIKLKMKMRKNLKFIYYH